MESTHRSGVFASWVTGAITASGGAWNASIVSELVSWGDTTLKANGLGAYISEATGKGDWPRIVLGVGLMSIFVVGLNRLSRRPLYDLAETQIPVGVISMRTNVKPARSPNRLLRAFPCRRAANRPCSKRSLSISLRVKWWRCSGVVVRVKAPCYAFSPA